MRPRIKKPHYFYDEKLIILIKDRRGNVVVELEGNTKRHYDAAMRRLRRMNRKR